MFRLLSIVFLLNLITGLNPAQAQAPTRRTGSAPGTPDAAHPRSAHARLCHGEGITRRRDSLRRRPTETSSLAPRTTPRRR